MMSHFKSLPVFRDPLYRKVLYAEWTLLFVAIFFGTLAWRFSPPHEAAPHIGPSIVLLTVIAALSIYLPVKHGQVVRFLFIVLEIAIVTMASIFGVARFVSTLYMVFVAKACLLLDRKGLWTSVFLGFLAQVLSSAWKLKYTEDVFKIRDWGEVLPWLVSGSFLLNISFGALMVVVALLTLSLIAEQKLRLEQERLTKEVEQLATELERTRIAREIHDSLGHTLTSLKIQLEVSRRFSDRDQARSQEALGIAEQLASRSLTDVRMALQSIRNADFDVKEAICGLIEEVNEAGAVKIEFKDHSQHVDPRRGYQLFRIVQECVTNTLKHAQASAVTVSMRSQDGGVEVEVKDNGLGITDGPGKGDGFGLKGIKERIAALEGKYAIESSPGKGTSVKAWIPLIKSEEPAVPSGESPRLG
jgi:signal transduction histidine kinase